MGRLARLDGVLEGKNNWVWESLEVKRVGILMVRPVHLLISSNR